MFVSSGVRGLLGRGCGCGCCWEWGLVRLVWIVCNGIGLAVLWVFVFSFPVLMRVDLVQGVDLGVGGWGR